LFSSFRLR